MKLRQIFDTLKYKYLRDTVYFRDGIGIREVDYPDVLINLNAVLNDLYSRFPLKYDQILVEMTQGQTNYILDNRFSTSNAQSPEQDRWILDDDKPFTNDISKIVSVTSNLMEDLPLNDHNDCNSVFTPKYNEIQVPDYLAATGYQVSVVYKCTAPQVRVDTETNIDVEEVDLSLDFLNVLVAGIAANMFNSIPSLEGQSNLQAKYAAAYELEILRLINNGLVSESTPSPDIESGGWA